MKVAGLIEKYFWLFLLLGIALGIILPVPFKVPLFLPRILLGMMLFLVFLKIDAIDILEKIKDYRLMIYISMVYLIIVPLVFYFAASLFSSEIATGILLLAAMPAGVSTPALTDMLKGNIPLAMSIAIVTQLLAPFTVPLLFWLIDFEGLEINKLLVFRDIALLVFVPLVISQLIKRYFQERIRSYQHMFTSANIFLLFSFVYIAISSQSEVITGNPVSLIWKSAILYVVFILLHAIGYFICPRKSREERIALSITSAYMNNGLAIVLAAAYFSPETLVLMVLSELPWNTLLAPFRKLIS